MFEASLESAIIFAGLAFALGFRWGMGRLSDSIDAFRESWEKLHGLHGRDDEEEEPEHAE